MHKLSDSKRKTEMARKRKYSSEEEDEEEDDGFIAHSDEEEEANSPSEEEASSSSSEEEVKPAKRRAYATRAGKKRKTATAPVPAPTMPAVLEQPTIQAMTIPIVAPQAMAIPIVPIMTVPVPVPQFVAPVVAAPVALADEEEDTSAPICECGDRTSCKSVEKKGRNFGKKFFGCPHFPNGCRFFRWAPANYTPNMERKAKNEPDTATPGAFGAPQVIQPIQGLMQGSLIQPMSMASNVTGLLQIQKRQHIQAEDTFQQSSSYRSYDYQQQQQQAQQRIMQQRAAAATAAMKPKQSIAETLGLVPTTDLLVNLHVMDMTETELRLLLTRLVHKVGDAKREALRKVLIDEVKTKAKAQAH